MGGKFCYFEKIEESLKDVFSSFFSRDCNFEKLDLLTFSPQSKPQILFPFSLSISDSLSLTLSHSVSQSLTISQISLSLYLSLSQSLSHKHTHIRTGSHLQSQIRAITRFRQFLIKES